VEAAVSRRTETWVSISVRTDVGRRRAGNEDNLQVVDLTSQRFGLAHRDASLLPEVAQHRLGQLGTLLIVSDGMGGAAAGEVASEMAVDIVAREMLHQLKAGASAREALRIATERANATIWERSQNENALRGLGATLTAVHLCGQEATVSQVGDSRAYLIRGGQIRQLTEDQSWANAAKKAGVSGANVPSNVILQALGTQQVIGTAITTEPIQPNDIFLLCSDGLSNKVEEQELLSHVLKASSLDVAAESLIKLANDRGGEDNITVVIARLCTLDDPDTISESRATRLLASEPSGEATLPVSFGRVTSDLSGGQPTLPNVTVATQSCLSTPTTDPAADGPTGRSVATSVSTPASVSETPTLLRPGLSKGGKLFVLLALAAVGVIILAGAAAMVWVLQSRAVKQRAASKEPGPGTAPIGLPPAFPVTPPLAKPAEEEAGNPSGIGRTDSPLVDELEKRIEQVEHQVTELARQLDQTPGYDAERQECARQRAQLAVFKEILGRYRAQQSRPDDLPLDDIAKELQRIAQWATGLSVSLPQKKAPANRQSPVYVPKLPTLPTNYLVPSHKVSTTYNSL